MQILLFILIFLFLGVVLVFSVFGKVLSFFFKGLFGRSSSSEGQQRMGSFGNDRQHYADDQVNNPSDKVFSKNEGEYVKFEEVE